MDENACNYDATATDSNGSCTFAQDLYDCDGNCLNDADGDGICDELEEDLNDALGFDTDNVGEVTRSARDALSQPHERRRRDGALASLTNEQAMIRVMGTRRIVWHGSGFSTSPGVVDSPSVRPFLLVLTRSK